jgi:protein phosphatase
MIYAAVLLVLLVVAGLAVGRQMIRSNYYVAEHDGAVFIMRGVQGSFLGMALQQPFRIACLDGRDDLKIIGVDDDRSGCQLLKVGDLRESERAQVSAGLPAGTVDDAIRQLKELGQTSLLPVCAPRTPTTTTTRTSSAAPPQPAPPTPGLTPTPPPRPSTDSPSPETPATVTAPAPPPPESAPVPTPPTPSPTVTALPPPPQEPGTTCRAAS